MSNDYLGLPKELIDKRHEHDAVGIEDVKAGSRNIAARVVVKTHRKLIEALEQEGVAEALYEVARCYSAIAGSLMVKSQDYSKIRAPSGTVDSEREGNDLVRFNNWRERCKRLGIASRFVLDIIEGFSLRECDKKYKMATGTAKKEVVKCLQEWV